jgi:hypothetical protein
MTPCRRVPNNSFEKGFASIGFRSELPTVILVTSLEIEHLPLTIAPFQTVPFILDVVVQTNGVGTNILTVEGDSKIV